MIWAVNTVATLLLGMCHIFHKIDVLGRQPPCLECIAAIYDRFYDLEGSAIPSAPVALMCYYMLVIFVCPLELGSAYRHEGFNSKQHSHRCLRDSRHGESQSMVDLIAWDDMAHLDVLIIPCWSAAARVYAGLTTPMGVLSGAIVGATACLALFWFIRSNFFRALVYYFMNEKPLCVCGRRIGPVPYVAALLRYLNFQTRLLDILWKNLDMTHNGGVASRAKMYCSDDDDDDFN